MEGGNLVETENQQQKNHDPNGFSFLYLFRFISKKLRFIIKVGIIKDLDLIHNKSNHKLNLVQHTNTINYVQ